MDPLRKDRPSLPYYFVGFLCLVLLIFVVWVLVRHMMAYPSHGHDGAYLGVALVLLGVPVVFCAWKIRLIARGFVPKKEPFSIGGERTDRVAKWVVPLLLFGVINFAFWPVWDIPKVIRLQKAGQPAAGVVTRLIPHGGPGSRGVMYSTEVRFTLLGGAPVTLDSRDVGNVFQPEPGEAVTVLYDPHNPYDFVIDRFSEKWQGVIFYLVMAGAMILWIFFKIKTRGTSA